MRAAERLAQLDCSTLELEVVESALIVTVQQPDTLNALAPAVIADLRSVFELLRNSLGRLEEGSVETSFDWSIRGVVLTGGGERAFVAGADIGALTVMDEAAVRGYAGEVHELFEWLETLPVPVIAAVNGYALGGGSELALACDMIYASERAKFGQPEVALGIIPGFGGCIRLQRAISPGAAREMIYTGRHVSAVEAQTLGLVQRVLPTIPDLREAALETIRTLSQQSPAAVQSAKLTLNAVRGIDVSDGIAIELGAFASRFGSPDMREGTEAFLQKRPARFPGA